MATKESDSEDNGSWNIVLEYCIEGCQSIMNQNLQYLSVIFKKYFSVLHSVSSKGIA